MCWSPPKTKILPLTFGFFCESTTIKQTDSCPSYSYYHSSHPQT